MEILSDYGLSGPEWDTHTMYLSFGHYYTGVSERQALRFTAIHEFGHALGFLHEQTANNAPQTVLTDCLVWVAGSMKEKYMMMPTVMNAELPIDPIHSNL